MLEEQEEELTKIINGKIKLKTEMQANEEWLYTYKNEL